MNTNLLKTLEGIGLQESQAKIYLALLQLGEATVQEISKKTMLKRSSLYFILDELKSLGLVIQTKIKKHTYFIPEDPSVILQQLKSRTDAFTKSLDSLHQLWKQTSKKPRIFFFDGAEGFRKIWQFIFKSGIQEYLIITDPQEMLSFVGKGYITGKIIEQKKALGIKSRQLIAFSEYAKEVVAKDAKENRVSKILPHIYKIPHITIIFGDRVAFISPFREDMMIIVESESLAKTQRSLFNALWDALPEIK